jgi:hypothetical protein
MQLTSILRSIALFAGAASAADYDYDYDIRAEARAVVRSFLDEYEELRTRGYCSVASGGQCTGNTQKACAKLCTGSPCAYKETTSNLSFVKMCKSKCPCKTASYK